MYKYLRAGLMAVFIGLAGCSDAAKSPLAAVKINTLDQQVVDFAQLKDQGKVTVVNFWATDCSTCKKEMPRMVQMYGTYQPKGLEYVGIAQYHDYVARNLSYGHQRRLEIARALATDPKLLALDEPAAGMNATEKVELTALLRKISADGYTILIIEHDVKLVMGLCDELTVLDHGEILAQGKPDEVRNNKAVIEAYLGGADDASSLRRAA